MLRCVHDEEEMREEYSVRSGDVCVLLGGVQDEEEVLE